MPNAPERPWQFRIYTGERPLTVNAERTLRASPNNGHARAGDVLQEWKEATDGGLKEAKLHRLRLVRARLEFYPVYPNGNLPDDDGLGSVAKACRDAVVDAGIVPDDNPPHVESTVKPPRLNPKAPWPLIVCEIVPLEPLEGHDGDCGCRAAHQAQKDGSDRQTAARRR